MAKIKKEEGKYSIVILIPIIYDPREKPYSTWGTNDGDGIYPAKHQLKESDSRDLLDEY